MYIPLMLFSKQLQIAANQQLKTPKQHQYRISLKNIASFDVSFNWFICNTLYEMYKKRKQVTVATLHEKLQDRAIFISDCKKS